VEGRARRYDPGPAPAHRLTLGEDESGEDENGEDEGGEISYRSHQPRNLYPTRWTVMMYFGSAGICSIFCRSFAM
jgi:hypothetical protein